MIVVGGTYWEHVATPADRRLRGSGLRAAMVLRRLGVRLVTAVDDGGRENAEFAAGSFSLDVEWLGRTSPIGFNYFTPLSAPLIDGREARLVGAPGQVADDVVLVFGMLEAPIGAIPVSTETLVVDPQRPRDATRLDLSDLKYGRLAVVANASETRALSGRADGNLADAAEDLRAMHGAEAVVVKNGARGALVVTAEGVATVGPHPTPSVWPLGSGDVFAAAFAHAWGRRGADPLQAARLASMAVSRWCLDRDGEPALDDQNAATTGELHPVDDDPTVYLAGPFFDLGQRWLVELVRDAVIGLGAHVFSPLHDVGPGEDEVAEADIAGLETCGSLLALLDGADPGTMFEVGYATRDRIPVIGYAERSDDEAVKMARGTGAEIHSDLSTAVYRAIWASMGMTLS